MRRWIALCAVSREIAQKLVFSRRFERESITKSRALDVRKNLKLLANVNLTNVQSKSLVGQTRDLLFREFLCKSC